jgi:hypothetical protein
VTFSCKKPVPALPPHVVTVSPLIGCPLRRLPPGRLLGGPLPRHSGEVGQVTGAVAVRACGAVGLVELDGQLDRLVALRLWRRSVLAAHFEETHRQPEHRTGEAVSADFLDAGLPAMAPRQLDSFFVRLPNVDELPELLQPHSTSTPDG